MEGFGYLATAYLGMLIGIAIWTWTVFSRSRSIESRLEAIEASLGKSGQEADSIALQSADSE